MKDMDGFEAAEATLLEIGAMKGSAKETVFRERAAYYKSKGDKLSEAMN